MRNIVKAVINNDEVKRCTLYGYHRIIDGWMDGLTRNVTPVLDSDIKRHSLKIWINQQV